MHRFTAVAALALAAALAACGDQDSTLAPHAARRGLDGPTTALVVEADLPIARLQVTIADEQGSRDVELKRENDGGLLAGVIDAQPGASAKLAFRAYDAHGNLTHEGEGAVDVGKDVTPQVELALAPVPGADQAAVRIGTYRLALTTTELDGVPGSAYDMEASLVDARGERHAIGKEGLSWSPPGEMPGLGAMDFGDWDDDGTGGIPVKIRFLLEKWYTGRMKICSVSDGACGIFYLRDPSPVIQVAAGIYHSCALRRSGLVRCWGNNGWGERGTDASGAVNYLASYSFRSISATGLHTCGIDGAGKVRCWGRNGDGQLGLGTSTSYEAHPDEVVGLPAAAIAIAAGERHSCAVLANGETWCWGENTAGELGDSSATASATGSPVIAMSTTPVKVKGSAVFVSITAGQFHTCGLDASSRAWCWGFNRHGEAGIDSAGSDRCPGLHTTPTSGGWPHTGCVATPRLVMTTMRFAGIGAGLRATCAHDASGTGYCWGTPRDYPLPAVANQWWMPRTLAGMPAWKSFTAGEWFQCGIDTSDMVQCMGWNQAGKTGTGSSATDLYAPLPVTVADRWSGLDLGSYHACGIRAGGTKVSCWGSNASGQLGNATPGSSNVPVDVTVRY